uniref:Uncharacterized protein n=1 Tax=Apteryx owenii TaxID=8824 RepID=A0A8B9QCK1_APTOW
MAAHLQYITHGHFLPTHSIALCLSQSRLPCEFLPIPQSPSFTRPIFYYNFLEHELLLCPYYSGPNFFSILCRNPLSRWSGSAWADKTLSLLSPLSTGARFSLLGCRFVPFPANDKEATCPSIPRGEMGVAVYQANEVGPSTKTGSMSCFTSCHFILSEIGLDPNFNPLCYKTVWIRTQWLGKNKMRLMITRTRMDKNVWILMQKYLWIISQ